MAKQSTTKPAAKPSKAPRKSSFAHIQNAFDRGSYEEAKTHALAAIRENNSHSLPWTYLGGACFRLKEYANALTAFQNTLNLSPNDATAYNNLGTTLQALGNLKKAIQHFQKAASLNPKYITAFINLGNASKKAGKLELARKAFQQAATLNPHEPGPFLALGLTLISMRRHREAITPIKRFTQLAPENPEGWNELAIAYRESGDIDKAIETFETAITTDPKFVGAITNLANTYKDLEQFDRSVELQERALAIREDLPILHNNLGASLKARGRIREALNAFNRAYQMEAGDDEQHFVRGLLYLTLHDFENGWPLYEYRRRFKPDSFKRFHPAREWKGENLEGKSLLIHSEQGIGDTIQFLRFLNHPSFENADCSLSLKSRLIHLCSSFNTTVKFITREQAAKAESNFDFHCYLMSLPDKLRVSEEEIRHPAPYLHSDPENVDHWSPKLGSDKFKIGINWQGNPSSEIDKGRSAPLTEFKRLSEVKGVQLISLQKEYGLEQLEELDESFDIEDYTQEIDTGDDAFFDTAAIMANLDLVITTDTAVAHLAAALGKAVWVILNHSPDWRWGIDGETTDWYSTARLFRQERPGDWSGVFEKVTHALQKTVSKTQPS